MIAFCVFTRSRLITTNHIVLNTLLLINKLSRCREAYLLSTSPRLFRPWYSDCQTWFQKRIVLNLFNNYPNVAPSRHETKWENNISRNFQTAHIDQGSNTFETVFNQTQPICLSLDLRRNMRIAFASQLENPLPSITKLDLVVPTQRFSVLYRLV